MRLKNFICFAIITSVERNGEKCIKKDESGSDDSQPVCESGCEKTGQVRHTHFFAGTYSIKIDKGRFNIPSKCRESLGDDLYLYKLDDNRIQIWSEAAAEAGPLADLQREYDLHEANPSKGMSYTEVNAIRADYHQITVDSQKRILLPPILRETAAGGEGSRVLTGCGDHLLLRTVEDLEKAQLKASSAKARFNARYD